MEKTERGEFIHIGRDGSHVELNVDAKPRQVIRLRPHEAEELGKRLIVLAAEAYADRAEPSRPTIGDVMQAESQKMPNEESYR